MPRVRCAVYAVLALSLTGMEVSAQDDTWTGLYIGANGGIGVLDGSIQDNTADLFGASPRRRVMNLNDVGAVLGGQVGYNYQMDQIVFGIEADMNWSSLEDRNDDVVRPGVQTVRAEAEWQWFSTIRGRVGWAQENWLFYATGGLAIVGTRYCGSDLSGDAPSCTNDQDETFQRKDTELGFTVGAGFEAKLDESWSLKGEYLYIDLGEDTVQYDPSPAIEFAFVESHAHIARLGLNLMIDCIVC